MCVDHEFSPSLKSKRENERRKKTETLVLIHDSRPVLAAMYFMQHAFAWIKTQKRTKTKFGTLFFLFVPLMWQFVLFSGFVCRSLFGISLLLHSCVWYVCMYTKWLHLFGLCIFGFRVVRCYAHSVQFQRTINMASTHTHQSRAELKLELRTNWIIWWYKLYVKYVFRP